MLDKTNLAHLKHKLRLMRQENGETTDEYLKRYSALETEIKKEEARLFFIDDTKQLQAEVAEYKRVMRRNEIISIIAVLMVILSVLIGGYYILIN